jgi:aminomethyltransferase
MIIQRQQKQTPLYTVHKELGARMVPFAGWAMPLQYSGILEEAHAVRTSVGIFDISHMGRIDIRGPGAFTLLQKVTTNDVSALAIGEAQYSLLTNPQGGIIDDIILYHIAESHYRLVLNAANTAKDLDWIKSYAAPEVTFQDKTEQTAMIAVQGPQAPAMVASLARAELLNQPRFTSRARELFGHPALFCRTGYTGEDGFEVIVPADIAEVVWRAFHTAGAVPCGLGARDALRIEAGYPLYGHEIDETTTPVEAGLMWAVKPEKGDFVGREAILTAKHTGTGRKLVGIVLDERIVPRQGYTLYMGQEVVGTVTSGVFSPCARRGIGMAYINDPYNKPETVVQVEIRGNRYPATVIPKKNLLDLVKKLVKS